VLQVARNWREYTVSDFDEFKSYYALADNLMAAMTQEQLADCLRVLALHVGTIDYVSERYRAKIC